MNLSAQLKEYKAKVESLAEMAAAVPALNEKLSALQIEKDTLASSLSEANSLVESLKAEASTLAEAKAALEQSVSALQAEKKSAEDQAVEMLAELGLKQPVKVDHVTEAAPTAESIRNRYQELRATDPKAAGKFFAENKDTILNGFNS